MTTNTTGRVRDLHTGAQGLLLNERNAPVAIVQYDNLPEPTWADWKDIA
ncbi:hypothetical protein [Mycolicibacterium goodii]|uniref:Uncharacterized protein n=1 Tax=Mycolicibacterium goodii TaxID=134601 RepID=A0ABS6HN73_MYCGD|nr:hypothetical protein [Mycolicibacterium goodii]MBU8824142.1 hypothetical protein [Mycolicibacterium goodii]MBU8838075.1 hypothetical protein [Mycolicibacterium goodii]UVT31520.1 hypothetical protein SEA_SEJANUS_90 [Mycobacterium phage Sejanus]UVT31620.1 hypothetical protein SEA_MASK_88 [Mycobacterium phage Mask]